MSAATSSPAGAEPLGVRFLLDTDIVSVHIRASPPALLRRLHRLPASSVALSVVTEMEVRYGLARSPGHRLAPLIEQFLEAATILPLTSEVARRYAGVRAGLEAKGTPIGPLNTMIAAHALSIGAVLVTRNLREFRRVPALRCEDWTR